MIVALVILSITTGLSLLYFVHRFRQHYKIGFYYIDKFEEQANRDALEMLGIMPMDKDQSMDLRGTPTHKCICGCNIFYIRAVFDNFEIATYFLDMECANCGSVATAPTPLDREKME